MGKKFYSSISGDLVFGASASLEGIAALAVAVLGLLGALRISIKGDPVRRCFVWFHVAVTFLFVSYILGVTTSAIYAAQYAPSAYAAPGNDAIATQVAGRRLEPIARFLHRVADALVAVAVVELAGSVGQAAQRDPLRLPRVAVYVFSAAASVIALAEAILAEQQVDVHEWVIPRLDDQFNSSATVATLRAVVLIVLLVGAVFVFEAATRTALGARKATVLSHPSLVTVVAAAVLLVVRLWTLAEVVLLLAPARQASRDIAWWYIADAVLERIGTVFVLLAVYFVGVKKHGGLWSASRSEK